MSHHDWIEGDRVDLPNEAGTEDEFGRFDVDDGWIEAAPAEQQIEAMRRWFYGRFEDPAHGTPYIGREGGYLYLHGGPYDPNDEIQERFGHVVPYPVMEKLINELHGECGDEWAPIDRELSFYDDELAMAVVGREDPHRMLSSRLTNVEDVLTVTGSAEAVQLATQLAHGAAITALESYLWDTVAYWVNKDEATLRDFVSTNREFQAKTVKLSDIFQVFEGLKPAVEKYLQDLIWHRLDKVKPLLEQGLKISVPEIGDLMKEVLVRHDIVHRGGRAKDGNPVTVSADDVRELVKKIHAFGSAIEDELARRYPLEPNAVEF